jgi:hypothetical protein
MEHRAQQIRAGLKHPVIDGDGHWMEPIPIFLEYLSEVGGPKAVDQIRALWRGRDAWYRSTWEERHHNRLRRAIWWGRDHQHARQGVRAAAALLNERLPELGIDFALIYPSFGLTINAIDTDDLHRASARAYNRMTADMFAPFAARFAPVAILPARTPGEAIEELDYAVGKLGYKAIMLRGNQERPVPSAAEGIDPRRAAWYCDTIALDSPYDYEPFWQRCVELGVAVTQHSGSPRWSDRASISNFTYNHVGHFAESNHAFARGVFLGGVVRRHPTLNFGFMEGGVSWACQMCGDLIEHWEKRRRAGLQEPGATDVAELKRLIERYGDPRLKAKPMRSSEASTPSARVQSRRAVAPRARLGRFRSGGHQLQGGRAGGVLGNFFFGCEADDHATVMAFDPRMGVRLRPVFSSDFTHFDVPDFEDVIPEAFEAVERGYMTEQDFREFTFTNAALLHTRNNPGFFKGTRSSRKWRRELGLKKAAATA